MSGVGAGMTGMIQTSGAGRSTGTLIWLGGASFVFVLALVLSWSTRQRLDAQLDRFDARALDAAAKVLDSVLSQQRAQLASMVGVLSDDSRIRAMVLTPSFDHATAQDLLADLRATSKASVVAMLDSAGTVRAVVGAPEMDQLALGSSSLVKDALDKPSARLWTFANEVGVLAAAPVRLDQQVRALFMLGFELDDAVLAAIEQALGASGAVFAGESLVASATRDAEMERALRSAAELPPGEYHVIAGKFLATSAPMSDSAVAAKAAWIVPLHRQMQEMSVTRALSWLPAVLVGLVLAFMIGFTVSQSRAGRSPG